jgi:hypothetical protein
VAVEPGAQRLDQRITEAREDLAATLLTDAMDEKNPQRMRRVLRR